MAKKHYNDVLPPAVKFIPLGRTSTMVHEKDVSNILFLGPY